MVVVVVVVIFTVAMMMVVVVMMMMTMMVMMMMKKLNQINHVDTYQGPKILCRRLPPLTLEALVRFGETSTTERTHILGTFLSLTSRSSTTYG